jgi:hypothetical protein
VPRNPLPTAQDLVPYATAVLGLQVALNLPADPPAASRAELDALHAHLVALHALLDAHHSCRPDPARGSHLLAACHRVWQAADAVHTAYHAAPRGEAHLPGLPEGAPLLTICQRHQRATRLARRRMTPTDIARP